MAIRSRLRRLPWLVVPVAVGALVALGIARRQPAIDPVNPDLRNPVLYLPLNLTSTRALQVIRSLPMPATGIRPGVTVESRTIRTDDGRDLRVLVYDKPGRERPSAAMVWLHGGGMVLGVPEQGHVLCSRWVDELDLLAVAPDYRLAPEDPFPAGLEDCYAALRWAHAEADALGIDPARVAVGGDSAGGGLAAALSLVARDRGGPPICFQLLEYPMLDDRTVLRADHGGTGAFIWTPASNRFGWTCYLGHEPTEAEAPAYAAPARSDQLGGLPPAWVGVGDLDLFHDEDVEYARRLEAAGVETDLYIEPGMYHGADSIVPDATTSRAFRDAMTAALANAVAARASAT